MSFDWILGFPLRRIRGGFTRGGAWAVQEEEQEQEQEEQEEQQEEEASMEV